MTFLFRKKCVKKHNFKSSDSSKKNPLLDLPHPTSLSILVLPLLKAKLRGLGQQNLPTLARRREITQEPGVSQKLADRRSLRWVEDEYPREYL